MLGLALVAKEFIVILLTEKWLESARLMQMLCVAGAFVPISSLFSNLLITRGHSTVYMWCSIAQCLIQLGAAILAAPYGISRMIQVYVAIQIGWILVWHFFARKEIGLNIVEVLKDIFPYMTLATLFVIAAWLLTAGITNLYISFALKVFIVAPAYCVSLWLLNSVIFKEAVQFIFKRKMSTP
jgi:O-antigen/teichoic acid export membrane protein